MLSAGCQKECNKFSSQSTRLINCLLSRLTDSLSVSVALFFKKKRGGGTTAIHCWLLCRQVVTSEMWNEVMLLERVVSDKAAVPHCFVTV